MSKNSLSAVSDKSASVLKTGGWIFLFAEILIIGSLYLIYLVNSTEFQQDFKLAALNLNLTLATLNSVILITGSMTIALSVIAMQKGNRFLSIILLSMTILISIVFISNLFVELAAISQKEIIFQFNSIFNWQKGQELFFALYHIFILIISIKIIYVIASIIFTLMLIKRKKISSGQTARLEKTGMFFHLIVCVWLIVIPLFYIVR